MVDMNWQLTEYLSQTTVDAAAAGLQLLDWITLLDEQVSWTAQNGRIQFRSPHQPPNRPFCTLQPTTDAVVCILHYPSRSQRHTLTHLSDIQAALHQEIHQAYAASGKHVSFT